MFKQIYKDLGVVQDEKESNKVVNLMRKPPKEKVVPTVRNFEPNARHQADTLYLPKDPNGGYTHALVVVDTSTKKGDARPMRGFKSSEVLKALKSIYKGKYLKKPSVAFETDKGVEFQDQVDTWLSKENIIHKVARTNRHRQVGLAEYLNYVISRSTNTRQKAQELLTGEVSKEWVSDLPKIVQRYNNRSSAKKERVSVKKKIDDTPTLKCKGMSCKLLEKGTKVRVIADQPINPVTGKKEIGKFRAGDFRWDTKTRTITRIMLKAGQPPMYRVSGIGDALYTREQLQLVSEDEKAPQKTSQKKWIIEKIVRKKCVNNRVFYTVKWKNYKKTTDEPRSQLIKDVGDMVKKYEKEHKNNVCKKAHKAVTNK